MVLPGTQRLLGSSDRVN